MVSAGPVTNIKMPQSIERPAVTKPGQLFTLLNSAKQILRRPAFRSHLKDQPHA